MSDSLKYPACRQHFSFSFSGRLRYKFASFWNRNQAERALQRALKNFCATVQADKVLFSLCFMINFQSVELSIDLKAQNAVADILGQESLTHAFWRLFLDA